MSTAATERGTVDLARVAGFRLGQLRVDPPVRELARDDGIRQLLEPRVMQVLVVLAQAEGAVVSREDLIERCWGGRVVGDSAINRVILLLRRVAAEIGEDAFQIDTVARVGYRLTRIGDDAEIAGELKTEAETASRRGEEQRAGRRRVVAGGLLAIVAAGGGHALWLRGSGTVAGTIPAEARALIDQARIISQQSTAEGTNQAIGLLRRAVEIAPDSSEAWGMLAHQYAVASQHWSPQMEQQMRVRADGAVRRARELEPDSALAAAAEAMLLPRKGAELTAERILRKGLVVRRGSSVLLNQLAWVMLNVGRCGEAADLSTLVMNEGRPSPNQMYAHVVMLWAAGRLEEAERAMDAAYELFASHYAIWFTRLYLLMYSGRLAEARQQNANAEGRPTGVSPNNFTMLDLVARAMQSRRSAEIDKAIRVNDALARSGTGYCENAIQFASALGRIDDAFKLANAYYFGRGFEVADVRFSADQRTYSQRKNRRLHILFLPSTDAMRCDPRFGTLTAEVGLERYWRESGTQPDFRRG
jgi:DNA-binding winged helix-turn-helix (wHTH) protein